MNNIAPTDLILILSAKQTFKDLHKFYWKDDS